MVNSFSFSIGTEGGMSRDVYLDKEQIARERNLLLRVEPTCKQRGAVDYRFELGVGDGDAFLHFNS